MSITTSDIPYKVDSYYSLSYKPLPDNLYQFLHCAVLHGLILILSPLSSFNGDIKNPPDYAEGLVYL